MLAPDGACVSTDAHVRRGRGGHPGARGEGVNFDVDDTESAPGRPQLLVKADIGLGHLQIDRLGDACA